MQNRSSATIRQSNTDAVYWFIFSRGSASIRDIAEGLDLSLPTVNQHLRKLQSARLISASGVMNSTGGRKARAFSVDTGHWLALGIDVTRRSLSVVGVNLMGELVFHHRIRASFENTDAYYDFLGAFVLDNLRAEGFTEKNVLGAGISLPAILSESGDCAVNSAPLGEMVIHLSAFSRVLPFPCSLHNDASAGGYAAFFTLKSFPPLGNGSMVYLSVSDTVGGAIMIDGRMYPGTQKHSAEFGHMTLHPGGEPCYCGQRGCAYVYINTRRLSEVAGGELKRFFELLKADDPACRQAWDRYLADLSMVIGNIRTALDCSVVIGGYLGWYIGPYMADVRARLAQRNMFEKSGDYAIACTKVIEITAVGAALSCQHAAIQNMIAGGCADIAADDSADP